MSSPIVRNPHHSCHASHTLQGLCSQRFKPSLEAGNSNNGRHTTFISGSSSRWAFILLPFNSLSGAIGRQAKNRFFFNYQKAQVLSAFLSALDQLGGKKCARQMSPRRTDSAESHLHRWRASLRSPPLPNCLLSLPSCRKQPHNAASVAPATPEVRARTICEEWRSRHPTVRCISNL